MSDLEEIKNIKPVLKHNFEFVSDDLEIILPKDYILDMGEKLDALNDAAFNMKANKYISDPTIILPDEDVEKILEYLHRSKQDNKYNDANNKFKRLKNYKKLIFDNFKDINSSDCNKVKTINKLKKIYFNNDIGASYEDCEFDLQRYKKVLILNEILN